MLFKKNLLTGFYFITLVLFSIVFLSLDSVAQTKVGYIDSKKIMDNLQEAKDAKMKLDNIVADWQKELTSLQDSLKRVKDDYDKKKLILTDQMKTQREKDISDLDAFISGYKTRKFGEGGEYYQKQTEVMKPVYDRIFKAIETVAKQDDYDYVFDRSSDLMLLFVNEKYDLTAKVVKVIEGK